MSDATQRGWLEIKEFLATFGVMLAIAGATLDVLEPLTRPHKSLFSLG